MNAIWALVCLCVGVPISNACSFPSDFTGTWIHSVYGSVTLTSTTMVLSDYPTGSAVTLNCNTELTTDTKFILLSDQFSNALGNNVYLLGCFELTKLKDNLYKLIQKTSENSKVYNYRFIESASNSDTTEGTVCSDTSSGPTTEYNLMMKTNQISTVKTDIASELQGKLSYTFDTCTSNSGYADMCSDASLIDVDYSECSDIVGYSASGELNVVYYTSADGTYTVWAWNTDTTAIDNTATYYFTCFMFSVSGSTVITLSGTQNPRFCDSTQTNTTAASTGKVITGTYQSSLRVDGGLNILISLMSCVCYILLKQ